MLMRLRGTWRRPRSPEEQTEQERKRPAQGDERSEMVTILPEPCCIVTEGKPTSRGMARAPFDGGLLEALLLQEHFARLIARLLSSGRAHSRRGLAVVSGLPN